MAPTNAIKRKLTLADMHPASIVSSTVFPEDDEKEEDDDETLPDDEDDSGFEFHDFDEADYPSIVNLLR